MEETNDVRNWREVVKDYDGELHGKLVNYIGRISREGFTNSKKIQGAYPCRSIILELNLKVVLNLMQKGL